jgi:hypothetical protein
MSPNAGGGGELWGLSQGVQLYTGAQINFGDLTPYLTYAPNFGYWGRGTLACGRGGGGSQFRGEGGILCGTLYAYVYVLCVVQRGMKRPKLVVFESCKIWHYF